MELKEKPKSYSYFDKPDGEDIVDKLWHVSKATAAAAFAFSTIDVMLYSKPKGYVNTLARVGAVSLPLFGASTAFVLLSNLTASIRKKSDSVNWAVGGAAAGAMIGIARRNQPMAYTLAVAGGVVGYLRKYAHEQNYNIFPTEPTARPHYSLRSGGYDFTLSQERKGNYVAIPAGQEK